MTDASVSSATELPAHGRAAGWKEFILPSGGVCRLQLVKQEQQSGSIWEQPLLFQVEKVEFLRDELHH